jgi:hypothetical protein
VPRQSPINLMIILIILRYPISIPPRNLRGKTFFAQRKNFNAQWIFSRQNFFLFRKISLFQDTRKNFGGKKINWTKKFFRWAKKVGPISGISKKIEEKISSIFSTFFWFFFPSQTFIMAINQIMIFYENEKNNDKNFH